MPSRATALLLATAAGAVLALPAGAAAWGPAVRLAPGDGAANRAAAVAQNAAGDVVAAWVSSPAAAGPGTGRVMIATRTAPGGRWTAPAAVSPAGVSAPAVALNSRGRAVVAWPLRDRVQVAVRAGRRAPWRTTTLVRAGGPVTDVAVAVGSGGAASVMWNERHGSRYRVRMAEDRAGDGRWVVRGSAGAAGGRPVLAVTPRHGGAAVWAEGGAIRGLRNPGGAFERAARLGAGDGRSPAGLAMAPDGRVLAAWGAELPGGTIVVSAADRRVRGGWRGLGDIGVGARPTVGMNAAGDAVVAWPTSDADGRAGIEGVARMAGGAWRTITIVRLTACGCTYAVDSVAVDGAGAAHVVWSRSGSRAGAVTALATREAGEARWRHRGLGAADADAATVSAGAGRGAAVAWVGADGGVRVRVRTHGR